MTRIVLIRHGVTGWNSQRRYCGRKDIGLSRQGRSQVASLFNRLNAVRFDKVYSSDRRRAMQTARILFKRTGIIPDRNLREIDFGVFEGLRHEEIIRRHADIYKRWLEDAFKNDVPGAEPMAVFKKRVETAVRKIVQSNHGKTVAVVCHGGVIGMIVNGLLERRNLRLLQNPGKRHFAAHFCIDPSSRLSPRLRMRPDFCNGLNFWRTIPAPASITIIEYNDRRPALKTFNDTTHLDPGDE